MQFMLAAVYAGIRKVYPLIFQSALHTATSQSPLMRTRAYPLLNGLLKKKGMDYEHTHFSYHLPIFCFQISLLLHNQHLSRLLVLFDVQKTQQNMDHKKKNKRVYLFPN